MNFMRRLEKLEAKDFVERVSAPYIWKTRKLSTKEWNEAVENGTLRELIKPLTLSVLKSFWTSIASRDKLKSNKLLSINKPRQD